MNDAIDVFYLHSRNPLVHALGVDVRPTAPAVTIAKRPQPFHRVLALEDWSTRPQWTRPALSGTAPDYTIGIGGLYWALHRMLHALFADAKEATAADGVAQHLGF